MQLDIFRSLWGHTAGHPKALDEMLEHGFCGMEARLPLVASERHEFGAFLRANQVGYIATVFTAYDVLPRQSAPVAEHLADLDAKLGMAAELAPRFVNLLAGNDRWNLAEQVAFHGAAMELASKHGQVCVFETHRSRSLFNPWVTLELIRQLPALRFTSDISHWIVTCERLLDDPADDLSAFVERVHHIQARVGYDQGPQVPHPGAPEYARELAFHQHHWEAVWRAQQARGYAVSTLTPEFGADGYLHHLPFTNVPVADLWSLNVWMAHAERAHFERFSQAGGDSTFPDQEPRHD
jgi:hypothetical protein